VAVRLVSAPRGGLYRLGHHPDPFIWEGTVEPLPESHHPIFGGRRFDDPDGRFVTLYAGTTPQASFAETIASFRRRPGLRERILAETADDDADPVYDRDWEEGRVPPGYFSRVLGHADVDADARFIDIDDPATHDVLNVELGELLTELEIAAEYDRGVLMTQDRRLTRRVAGFLSDHFGDEAVGLRYESRLAAGLECWALWPQAQLPLHMPDVEPISPETPELVEMAERFGLELPAPDEVVPREWADR
jgi:hypothetical protein